MIDTERALAICAQALDRARAAGAERAEAAISAGASDAVGVRLGALEDIERSEGEGLSLRVFAGDRNASVETSDFASATLADLAERAVAMARAAPPDPYATLATPDQFARDWPRDLDLLDGEDPAPAALRERAEAAEDAARSVPGVTNSEGGSAGRSHSVFALATSEGFAGAYTAGSHSVSISVVAGEGADKQRDYRSRAARHLADLPDPAVIGREAGQRAVARLVPGKMNSGTVPVVFDPRVGASLIGHLIGAMSGPQVARGGSFLVGRLEEALFPVNLRVLEEPHRPRGLRSRPFDGEGLATRARPLVEQGRLTGWLADLASARQLGIAPTGHGSQGGGVSVGNVVLAPGTATPAELMADIDEGVYVTELVGQGINMVTGDYSRGASGRRIVNGALAGPVAGFTIAGNLLPMFARLRAADDLAIERGIDVPTLRVDGMSVAGG